MNNDQFEALLALIVNLRYYSTQMENHPRDRPRVEMLVRERDEAIEIARSILVTIPEIPDDEDHTI